MTTAVTAGILSGLYRGTPVTTIAAFVGPLNKALDHYAIATLNQRAAFLATIGVESGGLQHVSENLNYGVQGLLKIFPRYFTATTAPLYARQPEKIANKVYANRMGNGSEASGDGWRYRGAGLIQLTGFDNQKAYAQVSGKSLIDVGAWLRSPEGAADSAGWFWSVHYLNDAAERGDMKAVTKGVNGGYNGLAEREALFAKAKALLV